MTLSSFIMPLFPLIFSPLLLGVINRTKAVVAGRKGQPLLQPYYDIWKLFQKGAVYSRTTTWIFRAGPVVSLAVLILASFLAPINGASSWLSFQGDLILFAYLLGIGRFFTVIAALDTGSSFEGMGASREVQFSALTEPVLFLGFAALARETGSLSLADLYAAVTPALWAHAAPVLALLIVVLGVVLLSENCRIPVDDPNTHLELTMIHEVMVLDHGGPDFAFIQYGAAIKLWIFSVLLVGLLVPIRTNHVWINFICLLAGALAAAVAVGIVESSTARLRLLRVPQLLIGAGVLATLALILTMR